MRLPPPRWAFLVGVGLMSTQAVSEPLCTPSLAFEEIEFRELQPPALGRLWLAHVSVDSSRCMPHAAGQFEIVFSRLKENGPDIEFREPFIWKAPSVRVAVDFWPDEAVQRYWIDRVEPCPCADNAF